MKTAAAILAAGDAFDNETTGENAWGERSPRDCPRKLRDRSCPGRRDRLSGKPRHAQRMARHLRRMERRGQAEVGIRVLALAGLRCRRRSTLRVRGRLPDRQVESNLEKRTHVGLLVTDRPDDLAGRERFACAAPHRAPNEKTRCTDARGRIGSAFPLRRFDHERRARQVFELLIEAQTRAGVNGGSR